MTKLMEVDIRKHNFYKRVKSVQDVYFVYADATTTNRGIFNEHIKDVFHISERTFNKYLTINAKRMITLIEAEKKKLKEQCSEDIQTENKSKIC